MKAPNPKFQVPKGIHSPSSRFGLGASLVVGLWSLVFASGCRTVPELPRVDLSQPGWTMRQGQAVWKANADAPEIAGELLLATHPQRGMVLQFLKTPFPVVVAQTSAGAWKIAFSGEREFAGRGEPPDRISWFRLGAALEGRDLTRGWSFRKAGDRNWRLQNERTGEFIEGYLAP